MDYVDLGTLTRLRTSNRKLWHQIPATFMRSRLAIDALVRNNFVPEILKLTRRPLLKSVASQVALILAASEEYDVIILKSIVYAGWEWITKLGQYYYAELSYGALLRNTIGPSDPFSIVFIKAVVGNQVLKVQFLFDVWKKTNPCAVNIIKDAHQVACKYGYLEIIRCLNVCNHVENFIVNAIDIATAGNHLPVVMYLDSLFPKAMLCQALQIAVNYDHREIFTYLLNRGGIYDELNDELLSGAISYGNLDLVKLLIDRAHGRPWFDKTLTEACRKGYREIIIFLVNRPNVNKTLYKKLLLELSIAGNLEMIRYISGMEIWERDSFYCLPALCEAGGRGNLKLVQYLSHLPKVSATCIDAALIEAIKWNHGDVVRYFLDFKLEMGKLPR